jgi:hypothetical protein
MGFWRKAADSMAFSAAGVEILSNTSGGGFTFGSAANANVNHIFRGRATDGSTFFGTLFQTEGTNYQVKLERVTSNAGYSYIGADSANAFNVRSQAGVDVFVCTQSGSFTFGPTSGSATNTFRSGGTTNLNITSVSSSSAISIVRTGASAGGIVLDGTGDGTGGVFAMYTGPSNNPGANYVAGFASDRTFNIGSTAFTGTHTVQNGSSTASVAPLACFRNSIASGSANVRYVTCVGSPGGDDGYLGNDSGGTFGAYNLSDERLKENIRDLDYGLAEVNALRSVRFDWKQEGAAKNSIGFIVQEAMKHIPEVAINPDKEDGFYFMSDKPLIPILVKAIQELTARLEALEAAK